MTDRQQLIVNNVDTAKQLILDAERWIWAHPQTGYTEWQAHDYLAEKYEALGYTLVKAGNIPGFYTDVETGKPGPKVAIFGELDALDIANHPESVNGMTHCCGHNAQSAALLGIAAALKQPHALDGLCGSIRLVVVPAEEMIQLAFREELRQKGIIKYNGGKTEFMYRGLLDGVDMAMMVHGMTKGSGVNEDGDTDLDFQALLGMNGCIAKNIRYKGKSAHAGGAPHMGVNAEYAAMLGLQACNDLRETFQEKDTIRGLKSAEGYIRTKLAHTVNLRNTPQIRFILDQYIEYGVNMSKLINDVNKDVVREAEEEQERATDSEEL